jgi:hypothetical protein
MKMNVMGIGVLDAIPAITVQLEGGDTAIADLNGLYQTMFSGFRYHYEISSDYTQEPIILAA